MAVLRKPLTTWRWHLATVDDECLQLVPGSHRRYRTEHERRCLLETRHDDIPSQQSIRLKAGQTVYWSGDTIHRGLYRRDTKRLTVSAGWSVHEPDAEPQPVRRAPALAAARRRPREPARGPAPLLRPLARPATGLKIPSRSHASRRRSSSERCGSICRRKDANTSSVEAAPASSANFRGIREASNSRRNASVTRSTSWSRRMQRDRRERAYAFPDERRVALHQDQHGVGSPQQQLPVPRAGPPRSIGEGARLAVAVVERRVDRFGVEVVDEQAVLFPEQVGMQVPPHVVALKLPPALSAAATGSAPRPRPC